MKNTKIKTQISLAKICRLFVAASFAVFLVLSYLFTNPTKGNSISSVFAEGIPDTPATSGVPVDDIVVLNLDLTHSNALLELTPHDGAGTFSSSSEDNSVAFNVSTNNYTGYTLYISSSSDDGYLSSTGITTPTAENSLSSIEQVTTESDFSNPSSTALNNKWGYKPSKYNSETNTSFVPAPTTTPTTLDTTSTYDTTKDGELITSETDTEDINTNTYTIGLGARVDSTIPTGAYAATFNLSVVGNPVPVTINYTDTSGDGTVTSTLPSTYIGEVSETRAPISTTTPERTGYTFKSWCLGTVETGTSENQYTDTCTGTTYNASTEQTTEYVGVDRTNSNVITLTAMWQKDKYLQTVQVRYQGTDGNYGNYEIYDACTAELYYGDTHSCSIAATAEYEAASVASYTVTGTATKQMDVARKTYQQTIQIRYQTASGGWGDYSDYDTTNCTKAVYYGATHSCSYGGDTTYAAASISSYTVTGANTKYMDAYRNTRTVTLTKGTGVASVTVTGTGVKTGSGTASATVYYGGVVTIAATIISGYDWVNWTGSTTYSSSTQSISGVTSNLSFTANGKISKTYMQDITTSNCPTSRTLVYDRRDEQGYYIQKIGNLCWMTTNLNLAGGTTLTPSTSNVASDYTLPASSASGSSNDSAASVYNSSNYGGYYSYVAAAAGNNPTSSNSTTSYDICPKGWKLPTNGNYDSIKSDLSAWSVVYGGYYNIDSLSSSGEYGYYWTSKVTGMARAYAVKIRNTGTTDTTSDSPKRYRASVRCIAK